MRSENYIVERIEELCRKKQISRYRLAQKSGISQSSISTLLNRKNIPTIPTLEKICDGFGITLAQFFSKDNIRPDLTVEQIKLLEAWDELDEHQKALVNAYMQGLNSK